jgi:hypothetical protein
VAPALPCQGVPRLQAALEARQFKYGFLHMPSPSRVYREDGAEESGGDEWVLSVVEVRPHSLEPAITWGGGEAVLVSSTGLSGFFVLLQGLLAPLQHEEIIYIHCDDGFRGSAVVAACLLAVLYHFDSFEVLARMSHYVQARGCQEGSLEGMRVPVRWCQIEQTHRVVQEALLRQVGKGSPPLLATDVHDKWGDAIT